jgi:hypothetical protein
VLLYVLGGFRQPVFSIFRPAECERRTGRAGFEPTPLVLPKTTILEKRGTETGTLNSKDPDLALVVKVWPNLPEHIKAAIKALIQTNSTEKK